MMPLESLERKLKEIWSESIDILIRLTDLMVLIWFVTTYFMGWDIPPQEANNKTVIAFLGFIYFAIREISLRLRTAKI